MTVLGKPFVALLLSCLFVFFHGHPAQARALIIDYAFSEGGSDRFTNAVGTTGLHGDDATGRLLGPAQWVSGHTSAYAVDFSNVDAEGNGPVGQVILPHHMDTPAAFTVSVWINLTGSVSTGSSYHVLRREGSWNLLVRGTNAGPRIHFSLTMDGETNNPRVISPAIPTAKWVNVTAVYDGNTARVWIDGNPAGEESAPGKLHQGSATLYVGNFLVGNQRNLPGAVDRVRIWDYALSQDEINVLQAAWPVVRYAMDEGAGSIVANHAADASHGVLTGGSWVPGSIGHSALAFRNAVDVLEIEGGPLPVLPDAFTISTWVKLDSDSDVTRRFVANRGSSWRIEFRRVGGNFRVHFMTNHEEITWGEQSLVGTSDIDPDRWYHIAAVWDGHARSIYINGVLDADDVPGSPMVFGGTAVRIGNNQSGGTVRLDGILDEFRIWNRALPEGELRTVMREYLPQPHVYAEKAVVRQHNNTLRINVYNGNPVPVAGTLELTGPGGSSSPLTLVLQPYQSVPLDLSIALFPEANRLQYIWTHATEDLPTVEGSLSIWVTPDWVPASGSLALSPYPIAEIDCVTKDGSQAFIETGGEQASTVNNASTLGRYREGGNGRYSRFAFQYSLDRPRHPHLVRVFYPDDKDRTGEIVTWSNHPDDKYNAQTGFLTGSPSGIPYPNSGEMQQLEFFMYPRESEQGLIFTTRDIDHPVACHKVQIHELATSDARLPDPAIDGNRRYLGLYFEHPQLPYVVGGINPQDHAEFQRSLDRFIDYMNYTGLNFFAYPVVWYTGPLYPSRAESPRGARSEIVHPSNDFVEMLLHRFEDQGFLFYPVLNVYSLPSLVAGMNADETSVAAGDDTYNLVLGSGDIGPVQSEGSFSNPPIFNILHPVVQDAFRDLVQDLVDRYGDSSAFGGVQFRLMLRSPLWLGSLDGGYGDYEIEQYRTETGSSVPHWGPDPNEPDPIRFKDRHDWLMANEKAQWVNWRCSKLTEFYESLSSILQTKRGDLKLVLELLPPISQSYDALQAWLNGKTIRDFQAEGGICIDRYGPDKTPGIVLHKQLIPEGYRHMRGQLRRTEEEALPARNIDLGSEMVSTFQDESTGLPVTSPFGIVLRQTYWEGDAARRAHPFEEDPWWAEPSRASALTAAGRAYLEFFGHSVGRMNADMLSVGGLTLGPVGHEDHVREFARVFRNLPASGHPWVSLDTGIEPVVGKYLHNSEQNNWLFLVNQTWKDQVVRVVFANNRDSVISLADDEQQPMDGKRAFYGYIPAYGLAGFRSQPAGGEVPTLAFFDAEYFPLANRDFNDWQGDALAAWETESQANSEIGYSEYTEDCISGGSCLLAEDNDPSNGIRITQRLTGDQAKALLGRRIIVSVLMRSASGYPLQGNEMRIADRRGNNTETTVSPLGEIGTEWRRFEVVHDVRGNAQEVTVDLYVTGDAETGAVLVDKARIEVVH